MNLEALALLRAEEQMDGGAWKKLDPVERRFVPRLVPHPGGNPRTCECGTCRKCKKREWMAAYRGGYLKRYACTQCGRRIWGDKGGGWCARCRTLKPGAFRRFMRATFIDGGGI